MDRPQHPRPRGAGYDVGADERIYVPLPALIVLQVPRLRFDAGVLAPVLVPFELAVLVLALKQGWAREKVRSWWWVLRHLGWLRRRRAAMQAARRRSDQVLVPLMEDTLDPGNFPLPAALAPLQVPLRLWWRLVRRLL